MQLWDAANGRCHLTSNQQGTIPKEKQINGRLREKESNGIFSHCGSEGGMEMRWEMCKKMMSSMIKTSELATFATPEVPQHFEEWAAQIEEEILAFVQHSKTDDVEEIAKHF
jgi:hypothetical protein